MNKFKFELEKLLINESIEDKGILKSCFMSGTPGAGKSFVISKIKSGSIEPRIVNTDKFTEFIANYLNIDVSNVSGKNWHYFESDIKRLTSSQLALYINSLLPL